MHLKFISVSTFIFSTTFCDAITQGELVRYLNGDLFYYNQPEHYRNGVG